MLFITRAQIKTLAAMDAAGYLADGDDPIVLLTYTDSEPYLVLDGSTLTATVKGNSHIIDRDGKVHESSH